MPTPTDAEITAAAIELDVIKPGEKLRPRDRSKVAKTIQIARQMPPEDDEDELPPSDPIVLIAHAHADLIKAGLTDLAADRITAALAPHIWRDNQGAAHARNAR
ncbi:hypothetical protein EU244_033910 [Rhodococcus qingshengii]|uniref:hypothetical protein n=1 Tax=Rhodococcus qingshengii TaxID=334542 RepID=UPI0010A6A2F6|nr:hypothetical protein [Rhodococcus qingshengii]THJ69476.1 hypothetical protein EU244_21180 [Rhodococcus qingshengii]